MFQAAQNSQRGGTEVNQAAAVGRSSFNSNNVRPGAQTTLSTDPYEAYDQMVKALEKAKSERVELQNELDRFKD